MQANSPPLGNAGKQPTTQSWVVSEQGVQSEITTIEAMLESIGCPFICPVDKTQRSDDARPFSTQCTPAIPKQPWASNSQSFNTCFSTVIPKMERAKCDVDVVTTVSTS